MHNAKKEGFLVGSGETTTKYIETGKAVINDPKGVAIEAYNSTVDLAKNIKQGVTHPIKTAGKIKEKVSKEYTNLSNEAQLAKMQLNGKDFVFETSKATGSIATEALYTVGTGGSGAIGKTAVKSGATTVKQTAKEAADILKNGGLQPAYAGVKTGGGTKALTGNTDN